MRIVMCLVSVALVSCADVPPTNEYDPKTPKAQQKKGTVSGTLVLPEDFDATAFDDGLVRLFAAAAPAEVAYETSLAPEPAAEGERAVAAFQFDEVAAGTYALRPVVVGFAPQDAVPPIEVDFGAAVAVGAIDLRSLAVADPADPVEVTAVEGIARLAGAADDGHGEIRF